MVVNREEGERQRACAAHRSDGDKTEAGTKENAKPSWLLRCGLRLKVQVTAAEAQGFSPLRAFVVSWLNLIYDAASAPGQPLLLARFQHKSLASAWAARCRGDGTVGPCRL
jgi:hypothetical protein